MKVVATDVGFYAGQRKRVGAVFDVPETFKASWVAPAAAAPAAEPAEVQEPIALSQLGKGANAPSDFVSVHAGKKKSGDKKPPAAANEFA